MSDVHLEFGFYDPINENNSDVLVLAGDICVLEELVRDFPDSRIKDFFEKASHNYAVVVYVMGNHEHYHGEIKNATTVFKEKFSTLKNIHLLDNSSIDIADTTFIGGTLWTNFNNDTDAMKSIARMMNDYRCIEFGGNRFTPETSVALHHETLDYFKSIVKSFHKVVVVSHHSPSFRNMSIKYGDELSNPINLAYHSNLDNFILDNPSIKLWISGHTHEPFDNQIGTTRMICNPRGYFGYEKTAINYKPTLIEI